jgi:hypothetical protein
MQTEDIQNRQPRVSVYEWRLKRHRKPEFTEDRVGIDTKSSRRNFLVGAASAGVGLAALSAMPELSLADTLTRGAHGGLKKTDRDILVAATIAEALAVTTYGHIIHHAPFFAHLEDDDQKYFRAAHNEEMSHYDLEVSLTNTKSPYKHFYYPAGMFTNAQTTLDVLVTLEDAFIAAYLVGVRNLSNHDLKVASARIMGIESDHRTLARVLGPEVKKSDGGPIERITGYQGHSEQVDPPNNNGYERTLGWTSIDSAVTALTPFFDKSSAGSAGFDTSKSFEFHPFKPHLPNSYGAY